MTEFGNLALVEERESLEGGNVAVKLPGVKRGDMCARTTKPEVRVFSLQFSPTGQAWAAATTEGLLIYSLNTGLIFDPWGLHLNITPATIRETLKKEDHINALMMAMKLNENALIHEIIENIPPKNVELTIGSLSEKYIERLFMIIANYLEFSPHVEFYLIWVQHLLTIHGPKINAQSNMPALLALQKSLHRKYDELSKICDFNKYTMQYIYRLGEEITKRKNESAEKVILDLYDNILDTTNEMEVDSFSSSEE